MPDFWAKAIIFSLASIWNSWNLWDTLWFVLRYFSIQFKVHFSWKKTKIAYIRITYSFPIKLSNLLKSAISFLFVVEESKGDRSPDSNFLWPWAPATESQEHCSSSRPYPRLRGRGISSSNVMQLWIIWVELSLIWYQN